jgi:hypothetical protein
MKNAVVSPNHKKKKRLGIKGKKCQCWWLSPAAQEAEIRKIGVQSQPGKIVRKTLS